MMKTNVRPPGERPIRGTEIVSLPALFVCGLCFAACNGTEADPDANQISAADRAAIGVAAAKVAMCTDNHDGTAIYYYESYIYVLSGAFTSESEWSSTAHKDALRSELACLGDAPSCEEVFRCQGGFPKQPCDPMDFGEGMLDHECDGDFVTTCAQYGSLGPFIMRIEDCGLNEDNTQCVAGLCAMGSCDPETTVSSCEDEDSRLLCLDGALAISDCGAFNECVEHEDDGVSCEFDVPCEDSSHCDGSTLVECEDGWEYEEIVCSRMGYECVEASEGDDSCPECAIPEDSAQCVSGDSQCEGSMIVFCDRGLLVEIDCSVLAGGTCAYIDGSEAEDSGLSCTFAQ